MRWSSQARRLVSWRDADEIREERDGDGQPDALSPNAPDVQRAPTEVNDPTDPTDLAGATAPDDLSEFCVLLDTHAALLTRTAAALVGMSDAEDAAQEAVVRAWRAWPALRDRSAARSWLISITINVCRDWLRGRFGQRRRLTESLSGANDEPRPIAQLDADPGASDHAAALDLRHAISTLDDELRTIVALRYYAGMDSTTIGAALDMPAATVRTKLRRALGLLRERLGGVTAPATDTDTDTEGRR